MEIGIQIRYAAWLTALPEVKQVTLKAAEAALAMEPHLQVRELSIVLADDAMLRTLNNDYRGINKATNVLAFAYGCNEECAARGDVIISLERTAAEAKQDERGLSDHLSHLRPAKRTTLNLHWYVLSADGCCAPSAAMAIRHGKNRSRN